MRASTRRLLICGGDQKDLMTVAKSKGWDTKALRRLLAERKRDVADLEEERQLVEQYRNLLL
jgi:uncharacterized protein (UPF0335 family)